MQVMFLSETHIILDIVIFLSLILLATFCDIKSKKLNQILLCSWCQEISQT